jgi:hypothetical protein
VDAATDEPVSLVRAVLGGVQSVVPVSRRGRGWELNEIDYLQAHYFQAAKYDSADGIPDIIVINTDRFPVTKRFPANGHTTFAEFSRKMYRNPVFFLNNAIPSFAGSLNRQTRTNRPSRCGS